MEAVTTLGLLSLSFKFRDAIWMPDLPLLSLLEVKLNVEIEKLKTGDDPAKDLSLSMPPEDSVPLTGIAVTVALEEPYPGGTSSFGPLGNGNLVTYTEGVMMKPPP